MQYDIFFIQFKGKYTSICDKVEESQQGNDKNKIQYRGYSGTVGNGRSGIRNNTEIDMSYW